MFGSSSLHLYMFKNVLCGAELYFSALIFARMKVTVKICKDLLGRKTWYRLISCESIYWIAAKLLNNETHMGENTA